MSLVEQVRMAVSRLPLLPETGFSLHFAGPCDSRGPSPPGRPQALFRHFSGSWPWGVFSAHRSGPPPALSTSLCAPGAGCPRGCQGATLPSASVGIGRWETPWRSEQVERHVRRSFARLLPCSCRGGPRPSREGPSSLLGCPLPQLLRPSFWYLLPPLAGRTWSTCASHHPVTSGSLSPRYADLILPEILLLLGVGRGR